MLSGNQSFWIFNWFIRLLVASLMKNDIKLTFRSVNNLHSLIAQNSRRWIKTFEWHNPRNNNNPFEQNTSTSKQSAKRDKTNGNVIENKHERMEWKQQQSKNSVFNGTDGLTMNSVANWQLSKT